MYGLKSKNKKIGDQISAEIFWYHKNNCITFKEYYISKISVLIFELGLFFLFFQVPLHFCILRASIDKVIFGKFTTLSNETFSKETAVFDKANGILRNFCLSAFNTTFLYINESD